MRPFVESVSSSRTRRELLRVRAKKDYHLEGLQAQTLAPDLAGQQIRGFVLRCDLIRFMNFTLLVVVLLTAIAFVGIVIALSNAIAPRSYNAQKMEPYECGIPTRGKSWMQFRVGYYLFAILFLMFEVETVFLFPWAVITRELGVAGLFSVLFFLIILILGLAYAWRKGALEWK